MREALQCALTQAGRKESAGCLAHKRKDVETVPLGLPDRFEMAEELPSTPFERTLRAYDRVLQRQVLLNA